MSLTHGHLLIYVSTTRTHPYILCLLPIDATRYCVYFGTEHMILCLPDADSEHSTGSGGSFDPWPVVDVVPRRTAYPASTGAQDLTISEAVPVVLAQLRHAPNDRQRAQRPARGGQGLTEGDRDRGKDRRQGRTGTAPDGHGWPQDARMLCPWRTVAAWHEESPWTA